MELGMELSPLSTRNRVCPAHHLHTLPSETKTAFSLCPSVLLTFIALPKATS